MYRHFLVPVDDSDLSIEVVGSAVAVARSIGARVTFCHLVPDPAAPLHTDAESARAALPAQHAWLFAGKAREVLGKAEAAARAFGVPCTSFCCVHDEPAVAIVGAALERNCDLIVMASQGPRSRLGMARDSETLATLMSAGLPVLVTHTGEPSTPYHAIDIIRDEHRSMAAVLHAWMNLLAFGHDRGDHPDAALMQSILRYLHAFSAAVHHPKEEQLFRALRLRDPSLGLELDELECQHKRHRELLSELDRRLATFCDAAGGDAAAAALNVLAEAVQTYAAFCWNHLGREEAVILPAARRSLSADDWQMLHASFSRESEPGLGEDLERACRQLFSRIVNSGPAIGP